MILLQRKVFPRPGNPTMMMMSCKATRKRADLSKHSKGTNPVDLPAGYVPVLSTHQHHFPQEVRVKHLGQAIYTSFTLFRLSWPGLCCIALPSDASTSMMSAESESGSSVFCRVQIKSSILLVNVIYCTNRPYTCPICSPWVCDYQQVSFACLPLLPTL